MRRDVCVIITVKCSSLFQRVTTLPASVCMLFRDVLCARVSLVLSINAPFASRDESEKKYISGARFKTEISSLERIVPHCRVKSFSFS